MIRKKASSSRASPPSAGRAAPAAFGHAAMGNAANIDAMKNVSVREEGARSPGEGRERLGTFDTLGSRDESGGDEEKKKAPTARDGLSGSKWGGGHYGGRMSSRVGDPTMGGLVDPNSNFSGGGKGRSSSGDDNFLRDQRQAEEEAASQQLSGFDGMSDQEIEAYVADNQNYGFASRAEAMAYAEQVLAEANGADTKRPSGDDNFTSGGNGRTPLTKQRGGPKRSGKAPGAAGGAGEGRADQNATGSGLSGQDNKHIAVKKGAAGAAERQDGGEISFEQALKADFHTDPVRNVK